jgi:hypothetical protein
MLNILVGGIVLFVFGAVWFTGLFGKTWAKLNGFDTSGKMSMKNMAKPLVLNFLMQVLTSVSVFYLFPQVLALSFASFWFCMFVVWVGFSLPIYMNQYLWERKPFNLVLLNSAYGILATAIISAIAYFWPIA